MSENLEFSFGRLFGFFRRWALVSLITAAAAATGIYLMTARQEPSYYAEAIDYVSRTGLNTGAYDLPEFSFSPLNVTAYRVAALSDSVLGGALESLGTAATPRDIEILRRSVNLFSDEQPGLLYIGVTAGSPDAAAAGANAIATELAVWDANRAKADLDRVVEALTRNTGQIADSIATMQSGDASDLQSEIAIREALLIDQQRKIAMAGLLRENLAGGLSVLNMASPPLGNVAPRPLFSSVLAFFSCLVLVLGTLFIRDMLTTQLYSVPELSSSTGVAVVAALPRGNRRGDYPINSANSLRETLRASRANTVTGKGPNVIHFTSPEPGDGSLNVAASLAESYARSGARTLLVDADMRTPRLRHRYRIAGVDMPSLSDALRGMPERGVNTILVNDSYPMDVLFDRIPVDDPGDLIVKGVAQKLTQWRGVYDNVVIHSPPLLRSSDGLTIGAASDATLLVVRERKARRRPLIEAITLLRRRGIRIIGIVMTGTSTNVRPSMLGVVERTTNTESRQADF